MLIDALRVFVSKSFQESFYGKKKKTINVLTIFLFLVKMISKRS